MRGVGPPSRAWEARVIAVIRHPHKHTVIIPWVHIFGQVQEKYELGLSGVLDRFA